MKTTSTITLCERAGSALIAVMGVVLLIALLAAGMVTTGRQQVYSAQYLRDYVKAQMIAEAGANQAYNLMKTNFAARLNPANFPVTRFDTNSLDPNAYYHAIVTPMSGSASNQASICSTGVFGRATAYARVNIKNVPIIVTNNTPPLTSPWAFGMFCNGYVGFNGSSTVLGAIHVNNYIQCNGSLAWGTPANPAYVECSGAAGFSVNGASTVTGTIRAPVININGTITTPVVGPVATIALPTLDLTAYYQTALANGQVFSATSVNKSVDWGTIPGGVRWINGSLTVNGGGGITYVGCVITTGDMTLRGSTAQTQVGSLPAFISRDGSILLNGSHNLHGLVYAGGDIQMNGSGNITGAIMSGGNILFNGSSSLNVNYAYANPLGPMNTSQDHVIITAWTD